MKEEKKTPQADTPLGEMRMDTPGTDEISYDSINKEILALQRVIATLHLNEGKLPSNMEHLTCGVTE